MFEYSDPAGRNFLGNRKAEAAYRQTMQGFYDSFANRRNSAFTWLDAFDELSDGTQPNELTVDWGAFPLLAKATDAEIDRDRFRWQDEYVEWRVERSDGAIQRITFITELPEYFQAFAMVGTDSLIAAIQDVIPSADPTPQELFGRAGNPDALSPTARSRLFRANLPNNPWNNRVVPLDMPLDL